MELALSGLALYILTNAINWIGSKLGKEIDKWRIVVVLSLLLGGVYYYFQQFQPVALEQVVAFGVGAFGASQGIWLVLNNLFAKK